MQPEINLYIDQGTDFSFPMVVVDNNGTPIDLSTASIISQMRTDYKSVDAYDFVCTGDINGNVNLTMPYSLTTTIPYGRYVFDAFYVINNIPTKFLNGLAIILPSATIIPPI